MSSTMVMDRSVLGASMNAQSAPAAAPNYCIVPRCEMRVEKCKDGVKLHCDCDDEVACATLQNLCKSLAGGLCCCTCTWNGMTVCQVNLCCGNCKFEYTAKGCCITCTSGDKACCDMLQACCDAVAACLKAGCCCTVSCAGTPICCGCCE